MKINCHTDFQPLKEIIVGRTYHEHSFDFITEDRIKSPLKRILEETNKDLDNLEDTINLDKETKEPTEWSEKPIGIENSFFISIIALRLDSSIFVGSIQNVSFWISQISLIESRYISITLNNNS